MISRNRMVRVSVTQETLIARKLGVDRIEFVEILYVNQFTVNYIYNVFSKKDQLGTISLSWSTRRPDHLIILKRFSDNTILSVKIFDDIKVFSFFRNIK